MNKAKAFQVFPLTLAANESRQILFTGTYFKIISASGAVDVTIEGQGTLPNLTSGRGLKDTAFSRLLVTDKTGAPNTLQLFCATEEYVDQTFSGTVALDAATLAALESVDLNSATIQTLTRPLLPASAWADVTATLAANTALTVFSAAANTNGAIIHDVQASDVITGLTGVGGFCARASAPNSVATFIDDTVILQLESRLNVGGNTYVTAKLGNPTRIPAGKGLYYLSNFNGAGAGLIMRNARYTLL